MAGGSFTGQSSSCIGNTIHPLWRASILSGENSATRLTHNAPFLFSKVTGPSAADRDKSMSRAVPEDSGKCGNGHSVAPS